MIGEHIPKLAGALVEKQRCFSALSGSSADWAITNTEEAISLFVQAVKNRENSTGKKLLEPVATVPVAACEKFVAGDHFKVDYTHEAKVKIAYVSKDFEKHFLLKVEEGVPAGNLKVGKLLWSAYHTHIMTELGEPKVYSAKLADVWERLETQPNGEEGPLLINGYTNGFYIPDIDKNLGVVTARWSSSGGGWYLGACSVGRQIKLNVGDQILSR